MKENPFERIRLYLFDMDGTLYIGNRLFDFTPEILAASETKPDLVLPSCRSILTALNELQ